MRKIVVFISGRGSNLSSLTEACERGTCLAEIVAVISDKPNVLGLEIANQKNIPALVVNRKLYQNSDEFDKALEERLDVYKPDWIVLAGFMRVLGKHFVKKYRGKLVNIHPSLLPSFSGLDTHRRALLAGVKWHGATVHFVSEGLDEGPIIAQIAVPVYLYDTVESLGMRVLQAEHKLLPGVMSFCVQGKIYLGTDSVIYDYSIMNNAMAWS